MGSNIIYDILAHSDGSIYAATSGGLSKWNGTIWTNQNIGSGLPSNTIWCVEENIDGNIWVGTSSNGVSFFNGTDWFTYSTDQGLPATGVKVIHADRSGNIWFGTGNGLSVYNGTSFKNFNTSTGLPGMLVNDIIQLANGNIAVGTSGGIGIYNYYNWNNITTSQGLPTANVLCMREDNNQNLWVGTSAGLSKYNGSTFSTVNWNNGLSSSIVNKLIITDNYNIWAASPFSGVTVYDMNNDFVIYRTNLNLVNDNINVIYTDNNNVTWIGTEAGLNRVNDRTWKTYKTANGLTNNFIKAIHKDINGNVWVGTINGLNRINGETITKYTLADSLSNTYINSISSDAAGVVYVATQDKVNIIIADTVNSILSTEDGLSNNNIKQVHCENDRIWYITDDVIQYFDGTSYTDATALGCAESHTASGAKCTNMSNGQYFGDDYTLRFFDIDNTISNCITHPFSGTSTLNSITQIGTSFYCSFDNGDLQYYDGVWTAFPLTFNASWVEQYTNPNYMWVGSTDQGIAKICLTCNAAVTSTYNSPTCYEDTDGSLTITSPSGSSYSINNGTTWQTSNVFNGLSAGLCHILVKNSSNAIIADDVIYIDPSSEGIETANLTISQIMCHGANSGQILLNYNEPVNHIWENGNTALMSRINLASGIYSVTIDDGGACSKVLTNQIIEPTLLSVNATHTDITCNAQANGSVSLNVSGGMLPYTYTWSNSLTSAAISNLVPNTYSYTVTDGNGCEQNGSQLIVEPALLTISKTITNNGCFGDSNGQIDITVAGGTTPYTITWSPNTYVDAQFDITNAPAGNYDVTVTDNNGCTATGAYTITQPSGIVILSEDIANVMCYGESTGGINIEVTGGYGTLSYEWIKQGSAGIFSTNQDISSLTQGIYHLTITDENLCGQTATYTISESPELFAYATITPISCAGSDDGSILASATGGSGNYSSYHWHNSENDIIGVSSNISGIGAGTYYVVVLDSYFCNDTAYATLTQAVPHVYEISSTNMTCNGLNNGTITVTVDGGTGSGYNFAWESGIAGNTNIANNVGNGFWSVTITDPTNCIEILEAEVVEPTMQDIGIFEEFGYICYGNNLILNPGNFSSYLWSTGDITQTLEVENEDVYFVEVVNSSGCHLGDTIQVIVSTVFNNEKINLASVTNDGNIKIMWKKTPNEGTSYYKIYRDAGTGFQFLANLNYNSPAIYTDTNVDTDSEYYKYKISSVDSCGAESSHSEYHRTCLLDAVADNNGACYLNWGAYEGFFVVYYFIERGTTPNNLQVVDSVMYDDFNWVEMNPNENGSYYRIKVRRIDGCSPGDGNYYNEAFSNIVFCDNYTGIVNNAIVSPTVYPNPFSSEVNINFYLNIPGEVNYSIINMLGQTVSETESYISTAGEQTINYQTDLESGIYILRLMFREETHNIRIVKN